MVVLTKAFTALAVALLTSGAAAHPGHDGTTEMKAREAYLHHIGKRSLSHCAAKLKARGHEALTIARRQETAERLRKERAITQKKYLQARDIDSVLATNHHSNRTGMTPKTPDDVVFSGNASCLLAPEVIEGPYYVSGEYVRKDIRDNEEGVDLFFDIQMIDTNTCEPLSGVAVDFWHCNSTGVYSGVIASGNGNSDDTANLQNKALRGIQISDSDGALQFHSIFPGHYTGRTNHIHVMSHVSATINPNHTISGGHVAHVGQLYFDNTLIEQVEATEPYTENTVNRTLNSEDILIASSAEDGNDPIAEYVLLGDKIEQGIFAWISFGVDSTYNSSVTPASECGSDGCVVNTAAAAGGSGGSMTGVPLAG